MTKVGAYTHKMDREFTLVFEPSPDGGFSAYVAEIPGVNTQGKTLAEARSMAIEALAELLAYRREKANSKEGAIVERVAIA